MHTTQLNKEQQHQNSTEHSLDTLGAAMAHDS